MVKMRWYGPYSRFKHDITWGIVHVDDNIKVRILASNRFSASNALKGKLTAGDLKRRPALDRGRVSEFTRHTEIF